MAIETDAVHGVTNRTAADRLVAYYKALVEGGISDVAAEQIVCDAAGRLHAGELYLTQTTPVLA